MLNFGIKDFIDILLVAILLYYCYMIMKRSRSANIFYGVLLFVSCWIVVSKVLEMKLLGSIMDQMVNVGAIALIILFQEEIRHFFYTIGTHEKVRVLIDFFRRDNKKSEKGDVRNDRSIVMPLVMACLNMSKNKVGALIVKDKMIISDGYNGTPAGFENVCEDANNVTKPYVLHAEANAITKIARSNNNSEGATLYVTASPCIECAKLIIQAGIKRVVYGEKYRLTDGIDLLERAGVIVEYLPNEK